MVGQHSPNADARPFPVSKPLSKDDRPLLEVCVGSLDDALAAASDGADRLELCGALELGGLTPSIGLVEQVVEEVGLPVVAMVRPRAAGFAYTNHEFRCLRIDAERFLDAGVGGIVFGCLDGDGKIAADRVAELVSIAAEKETVFHRAFDAIHSMEPAIETLAELGVTRVLTSGGAPTALQGSGVLRQLRAWARGRVEVLAGGGIAAAEVGQLLSKTGCKAIHIGASTSRFDSSTTAAQSAALCDLERIRSGAWRAVDGGQVAAVRQAINNDAQSVMTD